MSVEKLFTSLYRSVNGNNIRRAAVRYCQLPLDADKSCAQEVCRTDSGSEELETFYIAVSDDAPGRAVGEETVQLLEKLMANSQLPRLEYSLLALPLKEESAVQKFLDTGSAKKASGGVIISFCCARVAEQNEKFTLYRSSDITPFYHHALGTKAVELLSQISGIECETKALPLAGYSSGMPWVWLNISCGEGDIEKISPAALKGAAVFAAFLCCAGKGAPRELSHLCCEDWKKLCRAKVLEALRLKEDSFESRMLRSIRLAVWRELALKKASCLEDEALSCEFTACVREKTDAAFQLLCGGELPRFKSEEHQEIVELFSHAEKSCFDGRRTVFDIARDLWASRPYGENESWEELDSEISRCARAAEDIVKKGKGRYKEAECIRIETLKNALKEVGVSPGDTLMVHSSYKSFGNFERGPQGVIQALEERLTESGLLVMPAFTDCCDGGSAGVFDREHTPVEKQVGIIPEIFRQSSGVVRSGHPTHSLCAWGKGAQEFLAQENKFDCFAPDGPWGRIAAAGKILFLGDAIDSNTFLHACEAWYTKYLDAIQAPFEGRMVNIINYPGGCRGNWYGKKDLAPYFVKLRSKGIVREAYAAGVPVTLMNGAELAAAVKEMFQEDAAILLHKSGCRECARRRSFLS